MDSQVVGFGAPTGRDQLPGLEIFLRRATQEDCFDEVFGVFQSGLSSAAGSVLAGGIGPPLTDQLGNMLCNFGCHGRGRCMVEINGLSRIK